MPASTEKPLTKKRYAQLLSDIDSLMSGADRAATADKINAYYQVGARFAEEEISEKAGYHNSILRDISADTHLAVRSLQRALVFYRSYPQGLPKTQGLSWTHFRALLGVPSRKERDKYLNLAAREKLTARELEALIKSPPSEEGESSDALPRPTKYEYLYQARVTRIVDGDTIDVEIDLGFQTKRIQRLRLARINTPPVDTEVGRDAKRVLAGFLLAAGTLVLKTERIDLHGRYVAHLFLTPQKTSIHACFTKGRYLNAALIEEGVARASL